MKLQGQTALITGASQGLGKEIARQFLAEGARSVLSSVHRSSGTPTAPA